MTAPERIAPELLGLGIAVVPLLGLALNYTPFGIRLVPVLVVLSVFTVLLAVIAGVRRQGLPEGERFVVEGWGQWLGCGGDGNDGGRGSVGEGEGRGLGWGNDFKHDYQFSYW